MRRACWRRQTTAADQSVSIVSFDFAPPTVTINVGDTVTWTNNDGATHTTTSDTPGLWDSGGLAHYDEHQRYARHRNATRGISADHRATAVGVPIAFHADGDTLIQLQ